MYRNLEAEMLKKSIKRESIAKLLGLSYGTVCARFNRRPEFSISEAFKVRDYVSPSSPMEDLFAPDQNKTA